MSKQKATHPSKNEIILGKRIESLKIKIEENKKLTDIVVKSIEGYVGLLTNFASHDIKNAVHNMDSLISIIDVESFSNNEIETLKTCLNSIRKSLEDFTKLSPDGKKTQFSLNEIFKALKVFNKATLAKEKVSYEFDYEGLIDVQIYQPFHSLLQVMNNLVLNSVKSLEKADTKMLRIECLNCDDEIIIYVCDTGIGIDSDIKEKIFETHFTTTGGSGIGLAHAKFILEQKPFYGSIRLIEGNSIYKTIFEIKFKIKHND